MNLPTRWLRQQVNLYKPLERAAHGVLLSFCGDMTPFALQNSFQVISTLHMIFHV